MAATTEGVDTRIAASAGTQLVFETDWNVSGTCDEKWNSLALPLTLALRKRPRVDVAGPAQPGRMFLLWWKALSGSYLALTSASRR